MHKDIICKECLHEIHNLLQTMCLDLLDIDFLIVTKGEKVNCNFCNQELDIDTSFVNYFDDLVENYAKKMGNYLSDEIGGCDYCEGDILYSYEQSMNEGESEPIFELNIGQTVSEFLDGYEIPEYFQSYVLQNLKCECGFGGELPTYKDPNARIFDYDDTIFTKSEIDNFWGYDYESLQNLAERYGFSLTKEELDKFSEYIYSYPLLSLKHQTGIKLYSILKKHAQSDNNSIIYTDTVLYRGRPEMVFENNDMWEPPLGKPGHGRYNSVGRSVLYCAESKSPIPYEISLKDGQFFTLAEILVLNNLKCLDISEFHNLSTYFELNVDKESENKIQKPYLLPNFIAECCYEIGYKGVKYVSTNVHQNCEVNYALFNYRKHEDLEVKKIERLEYKKDEWFSQSVVDDLLIDF
ncbi:RES family NAD+ phosphorylase [Priestia megaterium]